MNPMRRTVLKSTGSAGLLALLATAGFLRPSDVLANGWNKIAFDSKTMVETLKALGASTPASSDAIQLRAPDIAKNGAVVPIAVDSKLPGTQSIAVLIDKNPQPLAASFELPSGTEGTVTTRVKMGQTSDVYALVRAEGKFYMVKKEIKVTLGGCGG